MKVESAVSQFLWMAAGAAGLLLVMFVTRRFGPGEERADDLA